MVEQIISTRSIIKGSAILITALAWNTAIKESVDSMLTPGHTLLSRVIYVAIITILAIMIISLFNYYKYKRHPIYKRDVNAELSIIGDNGERYMNKNIILKNKQI